MTATVWFTPWQDGPAPGPDEDGRPVPQVVVSVTQFAPDRPWVAVGVNLAGLTLRRNWRRVGGALGLWLWTTPDLLRPRSGSVTLWRHEDDLRDFVASPEHRRIVGAYRDRGALRSATWRTDDLDREAVQRAARSLIARWG
ncbi:hypothetical protein [Streptomyces sp. DH41]|uniref:hypothetical protein n=1 Tax=Streptomyces sp. DH41 TaxID=3040125 RepID=UPI002442286A|nr:hypothetical protein [Streptomyces sp. DH41]MDG9722621.1 hypothetical protein [Streptomyces sp. DH41]